MLDPLLNSTLISMRELLSDESIVRVCLIREARKMGASHEQLEVVQNREPIWETSLDSLRNRLQSPTPDPRHRLAVRPPLPDPWHPTIETPTAQLASLSFQRTTVQPFVWDAGAYARACTPRAVV